MGPLWISLLMLASFAAFGFLAARKLRIVTHLAPDTRWDHPAARLGSVLRNGFLQSRMIRRDWKPGVMHAVIFLGFMALLARKLQLIVIGYHEPFTYPGIGGGLFASFKDVVELAVLAALAFAFWRRYVQKPARLEANREALLILSLITAIMITDFLFDGFRFALFAGTDAGIAHERAFAFAGSRVGDALSALAPETQRAGYVLSYWAQLLLVFAFLVILPLGEHFPHRHRTARAVLSPRPPRQPGAVGRPEKTALRRRGRRRGSRGRDHGQGPHVEGRTGRVHMHRVRPVQGCLPDVPHRQAAVAEMGARQHQAPPAGSARAHRRREPRGRCAAAARRRRDQRGHAVGLHDLRLLRGGLPDRTGAPAAILPDAPAPRDDGRGVSARAEGRVRGLRIAGQSLGAVVRRARGLGARTRRAGRHDARADAGLDYLFYVGSAESFDPRGQKVARAIVAILREAGVTFGILGTAEASTGECVRRAGNEMLFQQLAATLVGTLNGLGVTRIVTGDPHAFNTLRNEYPEFGGRYEVIHHTQLIAQLLAEGRIRVGAEFERVIYHEPCYLGRHNGEYEAPRAIIRRVARDTPLEFPLAREKSMCCGAGGARMWLEEKIGTRINVTRVEQALPQAPQIIATACPYCAVMMYDGVSALGKTDAIAVRDLAELVADAMLVKGASPG